MSYVLLTKGSVNSDGQQFHLYEQNEQSPITYHIQSYWTQKQNYGICSWKSRSWICQAQTCGGIKPITL